MMGDAHYELMWSPDTGPTISQGDLDEILAVASNELPEQAFYVNAGVDEIMDMEAPQANFEENFIQICQNPTISSDDKNDVTELHDCEQKSNKLKMQLQGHIEHQGDDFVNQSIINELVIGVEQHLLQVLKSWHSVCVAQRRHWSREQRLLSCAPVYYYQQHTLALDVLNQRYDVLASHLTDWMQFLANCCQMVQSFTNGAELSVLLNRMAQQVENIIKDFVSEALLIVQQPPEAIIECRDAKGTRRTKVRKSILEVRLLGGRPLGCHINPKEVAVKLIERTTAISVRDGIVHLDSVACCKLSKTEPKWKTDANGVLDKLAIVFDELRIVSCNRQPLQAVADHPYNFVLTVQVGGTCPLQCTLMSLPVMALAKSDFANEAAGFWLRRFPIDVDDVSSSWRTTVTMPELWHGFKLAFTRIALENVENVHLQHPPYLLPDTGMSFMFKKMYPKATTTDCNMVDVERSVFLTNKAEVFEYNSKDKTFGTEKKISDYFWTCAKNIRDCASEEWMKGLIYGFIDRKVPETLLTRIQPASLFIRFSERKLNVMTIQVIGDTTKVMPDGSCETESIKFDIDFGALKKEQKNVAQVVTDNHETLFSLAHNIYNVRGLIPFEEMRNLVKMDGKHQKTDKQPVLPYYPEVAPLPI